MIGVNDLIQSRDLFFKNTSRNFNIERQKKFLTQSLWRTNKSSAQTIAHRSLNSLCFTFSKSLQKLIYDYKANNIEGNEEDTNFEKKITTLLYFSVKKAYQLGLKASGAGLAQSYSSLNFKKTSNPALNANEHTWLSGVAKEKLNFLEALKTNKIKEYTQYFNKILVLYYDYGRIAASSPYSLIYWNLSSKDKTCPGCSFVAQNNPWPKELLPLIPNSGLCNCGSSCECQFKIMPSNSLDYAELLKSKPSVSKSKNYLKSRLRKY